LFLLHPIKMQLLFTTLIILKRIERDMDINVYWCSRKVTIVTVRFEWYLNCLNRFSKDAQILNFMKIRPGGSQCGQTDSDRRSDMTKLIVAFHSSANAPKDGGTAVE
jgi:hypothetical protein